MGLLEFFSAQAGQDRRKRLDQAGERIGGLLDYYLGPTGIPQRLGAAGGLLGYTDAGDMVEAADASRALWNDPTIANFGRYGTAAAAMMLPAVTARAINDGVDVAGDLARFGADESGAIRVWHGSPHDFDRFSMDKIGTGEGAQAYGHGLYFAESEDVARNYQDVLASGFRIDGVPYNATTTKAGATTPGHHAADALDRFKGDKAAAIEWLMGGGPTDRQAARLLEGAESIEPWRGRLYEVDINADPDDFLDWDHSGLISEMPEGPQKDVLTRWSQGLGGPEIVRANQVAGLAKTQAGSNRLRDAGIPGIRYLDAGSRGADGTGSRNYVVFDENLIQIVKKYGIAGAAAVLGLSQAEVAQAMERRQHVAQTPPRLD